MRDMYVMKDSPHVISIGRLVLDDGYDFVWKHRVPQAILVSPEGKRHNLWTDNFTPMLAVQTSTQQPGIDSKLPSSDSVAATRKKDVKQISPASTSKTFRPAWYRGPKRYVDELQKVFTTSTLTTFIDILSGQGGLRKALQSHGHIVHSYGKNERRQDVF